jgi:ubiquinone/menaquinone biosynthesis C-methylase UbiE
MMLNGCGGKNIAKASRNSRSISRVTRSKQEAQATHDRIAVWYDLLEGVWEGRLLTIGLWRFDVRVGDRALEIGFGTGHAILAMARSVGESGKVYGIIISPRMLQITQSGIDKEGLSSRAVLDVQTPRGSLSKWSSLMSSS